MIAPSPLAVLEQALIWHDRGEPVVLVTLVAIHGTASRAPGTQMAVCASGDSIGSFSGGCIDGAIIAEAQKVLTCGRGGTVRFGSGSPYIDVRLPCGGGIDLLFTPLSSSQVLRGAIDTLRTRLPVTLSLSAQGLDCSGRGFQLSLSPPLRIVAFGQGDDLAAFLRLSACFGAAVEAHTPDADLSDVLRAEGYGVQPLTQLGMRPELAGDPWTAFVFLFHDHDWETALIPHVLQLPSLFCGAIGSTRTHAARLARLRESGVAQAGLDRLRGHIGLIPATRDPATLALSILAEVGAAYAAVGRGLVTLG